MNGFLNLGMMIFLPATFYGVAQIEARVLMESCRSIPETTLSLRHFLASPLEIGANLPPLIDHAPRGHAPGLAPEAICFYARWLHPDKPQSYVIQNEKREVSYRCL